MKKVIKSNFRSQYKQYLHSVNVRDLNPGDLIYMVNGGKNDIAIAEFVDYDITRDSKGRTQYEITGEVVKSLCSYVQEGQITNMFNYSDSVEVLDSMPTLHQAIRSSYELHYTGPGYPSKREIERDAKKRGFTHSYWASEYGYKAFYNGDTVVVYDSIDDLPKDMKLDAKKYGKLIQ